MHVAIFCFGWFLPEMCPSALIVKYNSLKVRVSGGPLRVWYDMLYDRS